MGGEPVEAEGAPVETPRPLRPVPSPPTTDAGLADLAVRLAAALRVVRGYVPHHIWWWQDGPAEALLVYQAAEATLTRRGMDGLVTREECPESWGH